MGAAAVAGIQIIENEQELQREAVNRLRIIKRFLRDVSDPFSVTPEYFRNHYRLTPYLAMRLVDLLRPQIEQDRNSAIPVHLQVLSVIRFLSEGSFQKGVAADFNHPMSQASMSRCIQRVTNAIAALAHLFINFPNSREQRQHLSNGYNRIPGIIGLIDCFKVSFWRPTENEEAFFNYNAGTSMNVQVICDSDYIIRNIRICPGSTTDQFIWLFSDIKQEMELLRADDEILQEEGPYYLLGDNGYTPLPILLTPITEAAEGSPEAVYTSEHVATRCKIEQCFGILTHTWFSISRARKLHYSPQKVATIITAAIVLHNYRKMNGMVDVIHPYDHDEERINVHRDQNYEAGIQERNRIIRAYYN